MNTPPADFIRPMTAEDLAFVRSWRNHPSIRLNMYSQHEVSEEEHERWFATVSQDAARHLLIFEAEAQPIGFLQLTTKNPSPVGEWGFYKAPDAPRGMGRRMGQAGLQHFFGQLGLHKVSGQALAHNQSSIQFHLALGFRQEGTLRQQHFDGQAFHDVLCFGLLADEWRNNI